MLSDDLPTVTSALVDSSGLTLFDFMRKAKNRSHVSVNAGGLDVARVEPVPAATAAKPEVSVISVANVAPKCSLGVCSGPATTPAFIPRRRTSLGLLQVEAGEDVLAGHARDHEGADAARVENALW